MSSDKMSKEKLAKEKIEKGQHYEAHQLIKSLINRKLQKNQVSSCMSIIFYFSQKMAKAEQYVLLCDLMYQCCTILTQHNIKFSEEYAKKIIEIFNLCPPNSTEEKYKFMNKCILWSTNDDEIFGYLDFHKAIAYAYFEDKKYSLAHNHFIYLEDNEILYKIICLWQKEGYPSESDFFILRTTLCLLVLDKFEQALDLINKFEPNLDRKDVPLPVQIAYLITCSCIYRSAPLYEDVKYKYRLILNYDPDFQKYIGILDDVLFNKRKHDLFSMFQNIFG
ncbi:unnamed protein product [Plasmodium vivax]|uniref:Uncharacterized protein n=6 Tax=Plasmodium vivax TaxID=5855 RepID=A5K424_PLAVS|nr:hypothetical protein, conserved [Plasmodium vivax]KMZ78981.1 hypothetical protein PVIIG_00373 [Plasmodium vivax India VII]KMZ87186.1 hypothetical protein PVBG_03971 [Plasmodium vivax Brazil I]KMZ91823.1 hypothetical protein PVMG_00696 [Plasmodium vivax Mauritania I]KMZ97725.1 hypothetical protein PVNG_03308 [Plasmodium vivax North Korean]EDL46278.1 hypothetical protein, conserved [Plasmodium vivax]|eukprot:XP_001616005.1 hypothetical protein [Plasmodium vivax Sal-1]